MHIKMFKVLSLDTKIGDMNNKSIDNKVILYTLQQLMYTTNGHIEGNNN